MRSLFFFWLTYSLASVGHLSLADFDQFGTLALQADDAITTTPLTDSGAPTELVADNPTPGPEIGAQDGGQIPENSIESNQQEGRSKAETSKCRRSHLRSSGAKRRREELNYCPSDLLITSPSVSQHQQYVRPTGNLGNEGKPGNNILVSPDEAKPEWAPLLSDFYRKDPCQNRPYRVCAPYVPGRDFEEWYSNSITLTLDLTACEMCMYWPNLQVGG